MAFPATNDGGAAVSVPGLTMPVPAGGRVTLNVGTYLAGLGVPTPINLSVAVQSSQPILVERPLYFAADPGVGVTVDGGTDVVGFASLASGYSFAEGTYRPGFSEFVTIGNPGAAPADVLVSFQGTVDGIPPRAVTVPPSGRATVNATEWLRTNGFTPPVDFSLRVTSTQPVVCERAIYFAADPGVGTAVDGGTDAVGFAG